MGIAVPTMIGRAEELEHLRQCVAALSSAGAVVLLQGDAGAGKTRMVEELRPVAVGAALEYARAPYAPIRDVILTLSQRFPRVLGENAPLAAALAPLLELQHLETGASDPVAYRKLLDDIAEAFTQYAALQPLVIAVEDAHWIDSASAGVLAHLGRRAAGMPLMVLVTYRGADASEREESRSLIAQLTRVARVTLSLKPLSENDAMLLINETATHTLPLAIRRRICELAQGSPLLLLELTRHACSDPDALDTSLPVSLQAIVHDRLAAFCNDERELLRLCAAMERFDLRSITRLAQITDEHALALLRKARDAGLLAEDRDSFVFRHALIRRAMTSDLLAVQRAQLHARIAAHLEEEDVSAAAVVRLAYHYWMAGNTERAQHYNLRAAEAALHISAYDDAAVMFERAIGHREVSEETFPLYISLAQACEDAGRHQQAAQAYRRAVQYAEQHRTVEEMADLTVRLSRTLFRALDDEGSIQAVRRALSLFDNEQYPATAFELRSLLGWYLVHLRRLDEARAVLESADELVEHAASLARMRFHEARAAYEVHAHGGGAWRREVERVFEIAEIHDAAERVLRYTNAVMLSVASDLDDYAFALETLARVRALLDAEPGLIGTGLMHDSATCNIYYSCGRLTEARAAIERLIPYVHDSAYYAFCTVSIGIPLALRTGDERLLRACARNNILEEAFGSKDPVVFGPVAAAVAEHMLAQGRAGEAIALVDNTLRRLESAGNNFDLLLLSAKLGSQTCVERAQQLLEPWRERSRSARAVGDLISAHRSTGQQRVKHALAAASGFSSLAWPLHQAQSLMLAGRLEEARDLYAQTGAHADALRVEEALKRSAPVGVLSKREVEVGNLIAQGLSNRAIAQALVLSERTVENHVASIFARLNARSRAEVASIIARENARAG